MKTITLFICFLLTGINIAWADRPTIAANMANKKPRIDGVIDDECWTATQPSYVLIQQTPDYGKPATDSTLFWVCYDSSNLFFAVKCRQNSIPVVSVTRRDQDLSSDEAIWIMLDTYLDRRSCYVFGISAGGIQSDGFYSDDGVSGGMEWDGVWECAAKISTDGWSAEIAIPLRTVKFKENKNEWGLNIFRIVKGKEEKSFWASTGPNFIQPSGFGNLTGLKSLKVQHPLTIIPYGALRVDKSREEKQINKYTCGIDADYRLFNKGVTASITVKPDYAQIEPDADEINLEKGTELYLAEKRPFFIEGLELFSTPLNLLYTRRIEDIEYGIKAMGSYGPLRAVGFTIKSPSSDDVNESQYYAARVQINVKPISLGILYTARDNNDSLICKHTVSSDLHAVYPYNIHTWFQAAFNGKPDKADNMGYKFQLWKKSTQYFNFNFDYYVIGKDFKPDIAYLDRIGTDNIRFNPQLYYLFPGRQKNINVLMLAGTYWQKKDLFSNKLFDKGVYNAFVARIWKSRLQMTTGFTKQSVVYRGREYKNPKYSIGLNLFPLKRKGLNATFITGQYYGAEMKYYDISGAFSPIEKSIMSLRVAYQYLKYTDFIQKNIIPRLKYEQAITKHLSCRAFLQYSRISGYIYTNILLKYSVASNSNFYFVFNETDEAAEWDEDFRSMDKIDWENRTFFLKASYQFQF